jgi:hypothetical protein
MAATALRNKLALLLEWLCKLDFRGDHVAPLALS